MKPVLSVEETHELEGLIERQGTSMAELMEHAGEFVASQAQLFSPHTVVVLTGFGNNGGDGWVAADILQQKGMSVTVVSPVEPNEVPSPLSRHVARRTSGRDVQVVVGPSRDELSDLLSHADLIIDAIMGTGSQGKLRPPFSIWIPAVNESGVPVLSVDVPSGLDAQTGAAPQDCIHATKTATLLAPKIGLYSGQGPVCSGELVCGELYDRLDDVINEVEHAADLVDPSDLAGCLAPLWADADKYQRGSVLVVAGSAEYPGAAMMAAKAAARAGAGYVAVAAPSACANLIRMALPSVPVIAVPSDSRGCFGSAARQAVCDAAQRFDCVLCGPGITVCSGSMQVVSGLLESDKPLVLDADALNCLSRLAIDGIDKTPEIYRREAPLILTPHHRELSRLTGGFEVSDLGSAIEAAQRIVWAVGSENLVVLAKGPTTAAVGVQKVLIPMSGPLALATAGSGDVLAGILSGLIATNHGEVEQWELLSAYAVTVHSLTGFSAATHLGERSVIATDLIDYIGDALQMVETDILKEEAAGLGDEL